MEPQTITFAFSEVPAGVQVRLGGCVGVGKTREEAVDDMVREAMSIIIAEPNDHDARVVELMCVGYPTIEEHPRSSDFLETKP